MADLTDRELLRIAGIGVRHLFGEYQRMLALRAEERASPADVRRAWSEYAKAQDIVRSAAIAKVSGQPAQGGGAPTTGSQS